MKVKLRFAMLLGALGLVGACLDQAYGANAYWAEEMDALPNVNHPGRWGAVDDANGNLVNNILQFTDFTEPGLNAWLIAPSLTSDTGMAATDFPTQGVPEFTLEARYRFANANPFPKTVDFSGAWPFALDVATQEKPGMSFRDGYREGGVNNSAGSTFYQMTSKEGQNGFVFPEPDVHPKSESDVWRVVRMTQNATTQTITLDGVTLGTIDITGVSGIGCCGRSVWLRQEDQGNYNQETFIDYIRIARGVLSPNEALNPVPEPTAGLLALVVCGLGVAARRRS